MSLVKFLVLLLVAGLVFGSVGFFAYQLYVKPAAQDRREQEAIAHAPEPTPTPDYSVAAYEKAAAVAKTGSPIETRDALLNFLAQYPQSPKVPDARAAIGQINTDLVFSSVEAPGKIDYTVASGDALVKIAAKTNSNAELIMRSNNLLSIALQIGQHLRVPQLDMSLVVDRKAMTLTLLDKGQFFKEYPLVAIDVPSLKTGTAMQSEVTDKLALAGSNRVTFDSRDYIGSDRWIMLKQSSVVIRGLPEAPAGGQPAAVPPGVVVSQEAIEEIFPLLSRGDAVTIQ
jgi:LysM repeat protein